MVDLPSGPVLQAEALEVGYPGAAGPVIRQLDVALEQRGMLAIIGRSGSGKTTFLHACAGLLPAGGGRLCVAGHDLGNLDVEQRTLFRRRHIGLVFQQFNLIPTLTALENLQFVMALNRRSDDGRARELLGRLRLRDKSGSFPAQLSGGEQQRVAVARALAHRPALVLADEPTGNLDLETARDVMSLLVEACSADGAALVLVTHSSELPAGLNRVMRMQGGRLEPAGQVQ